MKKITLKEYGKILEKGIEREKKKLWKNYTPVINQNFEAFELMRKIGVLQGKAQLLRKKQ